MVIIVKDFFVITNNPMVHNKFKGDYQVDYQKEADDMQVLRAARDYIHAGHALLTHPLAGSIKPNETPYKSIMLTKDKQKLNLQSVQIIEESIQVCEKFSSTTKDYPQEVFTDFQHIDCSLIENAIASAMV